MSSELPTIIRQLQSSDPALHNAALLRLASFAEMTERWRRVRRVSRRGVLRGAGLGFVALSVKRDD